ncbi:MAG: CBS domain-containing protein, partial [Thermodesulfovibrionales bacterium]|nr:CBS domain-containing protein [Thermodesulfovibrionales bacterium]
IKDIDLSKITRLIIVDTKSKDRIGPFADIVSLKNLKIHIYDHHPKSDNDIKGELEILVNVGAVSTIFAEIIEKKKIPINPVEATILCIGIYEETGSMLYSSTTPRDLMAVAFLLKKGANLNIVSSFLKSPISVEDFSLLNKLIDGTHEMVIHGNKILICKAVSEGYGDMAHLAHRIMDMEDAEAVFLIISMSDKVLIVGRSKSPTIDASLVLSYFGGGGHPYAASATVHDRPLEIIEESLKTQIKQKIRPLKTASDVMTTHIISLDHKGSVKDAEVLMTKYGINALPIIDNGKYLGIVTREIVEKAIFHGFRTSPCIDFASTDIITAQPHTNITEIESAMIETNQRFVPVLEGDKIIGAITRTDILRTMYEDILKKNRLTSETMAVKSGFTKMLIKC